MKHGNLYSIFSIFLIISVGTSCSNQSPKTISGRQPQVSIDPKGIVRVVYGDGDGIYYMQSEDQGQHFSGPERVAQVDSLSLGMWRGPQLASSSDYSSLIATDNMGNIHSYLLDHATGKWSPSGLVNDVSDAAVEGLCALDADDNNHFYATWLDVRNDGENKIAFSKSDGKSWGANQIAYTSPDSTVCSCCHPSIEVYNAWVFIMFRNQLNGYRDMYFVSSDDGGATFSDASKIGFGTWKLDACPMDGGDIMVDDYHGVSTA
jgi:hypothetical protein